MRDIPRNISVTCLAGILFLLLSGTVSAWSGDAYLNTAVTAVTGDQLDPVSASDGAGGAIVAWEDRRSGGRVIYAQRLSADGQAMWTANGVQVSAGAALESQQAIAADGSGGAYIAWYSSADGRIHLQHLDSSGTPVTGWAATGIVVSSGDTMNSDTQPTLIEDGSGGVFVAWQYYSATTGSDMYVTRIDNNGNTHTGWALGGNVVSNAAGEQYQTALLADGSGGVFVVWSSSRVYAQRLNTSGIRQWDAGGGNFNGIALATSTNYQNQPRIVSDGAGGAIVVWEDERSDKYGDIYGQRIDSSGVQLWDSAGVALVAVPSSYQDSIQAISDQNGGAYLVWRDSRDSPPSVPGVLPGPGILPSYDIYLHRIDSTGSDVSGWTTNGTLLTTPGSGYISDPALIGDGSSGAVAVWRNNIYPTSEMRAQRVSSAAVKQWGSEGVAMTSKGGYVALLTVTPASDGGALVAWAHTVMQGDFEIFAQRVYVDGALSSVATPSAVSPVGGEEITSNTLSASTFSDAGGNTSQSQAQWRVLDYAEPAAERPKAEATSSSMFDNALGYTLPFNFPFYGRTITAIAVNKNGLIELLEAGESCQACTAAGTHSDGTYVDIMDAIFASNDDLYADDGYVKVYDGGDHVMVEWYSATIADVGAPAFAFIPSGLPPGPATAPVNFQVLMYSDGRIAWNFKQMDFSLYDYDMYSGVYPNGGTEVDVGLAINAPASYVFDPTTQTVSTVTLQWDAPSDYILYDSGATATDLASHDVPDSAGLAEGQTYYWSVRYQNTLGDWTPWSTAASFTTPTPASSGGGGVFSPLFGLLFSLLWMSGRRRRERLVGAYIFGYLGVRSKTILGYLTKTV